MSVAYFTQRKSIEAIEAITEVEDILIKFGVDLKTRKLPKYLMYLILVFFSTSIIYSIQFIVWLVVPHVLDTKMELAYQTVMITAVIYNQVYFMYIEVITADRLLIATEIIQNYVFKSTMECDYCTKNYVTLNRLCLGWKLCNVHGIRYKNKKIGIKF